MLGSRGVCSLVSFAVQEFHLTKILSEMKKENSFGEERRGIGRKRKRERGRNGGEKQMEKEKNSSHELNAARKYYSRQPYYLSNKSWRSKNGGIEEKNAEKAGQRGNVISQIKI